MKFWIPIADGYKNAFRYINYEFRDVFSTLYEFVAALLIFATRILAIFTIPILWPMRSLYIYFLDMKNNKTINTIINGEYNCNVCNVVKHRLKVFPYSKKYREWNSMCEKSEAEYREMIADQLREIDEEWESSK